MKSTVNIFTSIFLWLSMCAVCMAQNAETTYRITVLKSSEEPQTNVYLKLFFDGTKCDTDEQGVISFKFPDNSSIRNASFYVKGKDNRPIKTITLELENPVSTMYIDTEDDLLEYRRTNQTFRIEGMLKDHNDEPIEGATVSIQGTGRRTLTDEIGLFQIDADYNHPIIIRADGKHNLSLPISRFLTNRDGEHIIRMYTKSSSQIYSSVETMPEFPGGMKGFQEYLNKNLEYPAKAKKAKLEGVVVVQFVVEKDGSITDPKIMRHFEHSMDSAAWRLIKNMPKWSPASDFGTKVRCKYSLPVAFKIPKPRIISPADSMRMVQDSLNRIQKLVKDSIRNDSVKLDELNKRFQLLTDSVKFVNDKDSLLNDTIKMDKDQPAVKAKKRNIFVRFFRWLFRIKDKSEKKQKEVKLDFDGKELVITKDSITIKADSIVWDKALIDQKKDEFQKELDSLKVQIDSIEAVSAVRIKRIAPAKPAAPQKLKNDSLMLQQGARGVQGDSLKLRADSLLQKVDSLQQKTKAVRQQTDSVMQKADALLPTNQKALEGSDSKAVKKDSLKPSKESLKETDEQVVKKESKKKDSKKKRESRKRKSRKKDAKKEE